MKSHRTNNPEANKAGENINNLDIGINNKNIEDRMRTYFIILDYVKKYVQKIIISRVDS